MRTEDYERSGYRNVRVSNSGGDIEHRATRKAHQGITVTLTPVVNGDETAERRIHDAEITATGDTVTVRLPDIPATVISGGGTVINQNFGTVTGTVISMQSGTITGGMNISSGGDIRVGGMNISGGAQIAGTGSVSVTIDAPAGTGLAARSQGGGRIRQFGTATKVDADTSGGSIRVEHVTDELELHTSGGGIRIGIAECRAEARTSGGSVQATDLRRGGSLRTSGGDIRAHLTGNYTLKARTSGGDITLTTADGISEDHLSWRTSGGDVEVNGHDRSNKSQNF